MPLIASQLNSITKPGLHGDGDGLYLQVRKSGTKDWVYRYQINGRRRDIGVGGYPSVTLVDARKERKRLKRMVKEGIDPLDEKRRLSEARKEEEHQQRIREMTFRRCAEQYITAKSPEWKSAKHRQQWENTLRDYVFPVIGALPVADVVQEHVLRILKPFWLEKTETATRVRNRIELVLDYAAACHYREEKNPARWKGYLDKVLPSPTKIKPERHHNALDFSEIRGFMQELREQRILTARALELTILTATRTSEALDAEWSEIDLDNALWTIPGARMKAGKQHRIPLSQQAIELLNEIREQTGHKRLVFPGQKRSRPLSNMSMIMLLRRMGRLEITVHGFRSTFRDWAGEATSFPPRAAEYALAHKLRDASERAYARGDMLPQRTKLMQAWADFCLADSAEIVHLSAKKEFARKGK